MLVLCVLMKHHWAIWVGILILVHVKSCCKPSNLPGAYTYLNSFEKLIREENLLFICQILSNNRGKCNCVKDFRVATSGTKHNRCINPGGRGSLLEQPFVKGWDKNKNWAGLHFVSLRDFSLFFVLVCVGPFIYRSATCGWNFLVALQSKQ